MPMIRKGQVEGVEKGCGVHGFFSVDIKAGLCGENYLILNSCLHSALSFLKITSSLPIWVTKTPSTNSPSRTIWSFITTMRFFGSLDQAIACSFNWDSLSCLTGIAANRLAFVFCSYFFTFFLVAVFFRGKSGMGTFFS